MFNLGIWEIVVIGLIALIVVGPEKLPELARNIGRFLNDVKRTTNDFTQGINQTLDEKKFQMDQETRQSLETQEIDENGEIVAEDDSLSAENKKD